MAFNEIINNNTSNFLQELSDDHDALSFCDLPMDNDEADLQPLLDTCRENSRAGLTSKDDQYDDHHFEFLTSPETYHNRTDSIIFCGKTIVPRKQAVNNNNATFIRRECFEKCHSSPISDVAYSSSKVSPLPASSGSNRSSLFRFGFGGGGSCGSNSKPSLPATGDYYRSSSGSSPRRPKMSIGLVRAEQKMEPSEMRKRQHGRRSPARMFQATGGAGDGEGRSGGGHHHHHHWGLLNPLRCGAYFMSALTKASFGCIPHV